MIFQTAYLSLLFLSLKLLRIKTGLLSVKSRPWCYPYFCPLVQLCPPPSAPEQRTLILLYLFFPLWNYFVSEAFLSFKAESALPSPPSSVSFVCHFYHVLVFWIFFLFYLFFCRIFDLLVCQLLDKILAISTSPGPAQCLGEKSRKWIII